MSSELSQVSSITETEGDEIVTSNQPVDVYVTKMYIDRTELTTMVSRNFLDRHSSQSRYMSP